MADKIVCNIVTNLSHFLANELRFLLRVDGQIQSLKNELEYIKNFLRNSEGKRDEHGNEMVLVNQIRIIADEAEYVMDTYDVNIADNRTEQNMWPEFFGLFNRAIEAHKVAHRIGEIKRKIAETEENNVRYRKLQKDVNEADDLPQKSKKRVEENDVGGFVKEAKISSVNQVFQEKEELDVISSFEETYDNNDMCQIKQKDVNEAKELQRRHDMLEKRRRRVEENDVVGFVEEAKILVNQLLGGTEDLDVISISGMGGLGKSTLAKKVYKDQRVKHHFTCRVWVSVSKEFKLKELLEKMLEEVTRMMSDQSTKEKMEQLNRELKQQSAMDVEHLKQELKNKLSQYRYLVVLDDIWSSEDWDELEGIFPHPENGSRVILTTRIKEVALHASGNTPLLLQIRDADQSWELFTKKVFRRAHCPENLESIGKKIVDKCKGLPLAIVVLGGLLARKDKTYPIWNNMVESIDRYIQQDTLDILGLSYSYLPPYLQPCFLYMGLFPEDHKINVRQLIQLWMAEGFIQEDNRTRMEVDAEECLQKLVDGSLVQVEEWRTDGGIKTCSLHDLTRELCIKLCMEEKFLESRSKVASSQNKSLRLSIHHSRRDYFWNAYLSSICDIRTLLCFDQHKLSEQDWKELFKRFKLLKVLDLEDGAANSLLQDIDKLVLLKYLRVKPSEGMRFPNSVFKLQNIQTIDLRAFCFPELPRGIWKMRQLRHLYLDGRSTLPKPESEDCTLPNLQTLSSISIDEDDGINISVQAPNLRNLGLYGIHFLSSNMDFVFPSHLQSIKFVEGFIMEMPIKLPDTTTKITVKEAFLQQCMVDMFGRLQNIRILKFKQTYFDDGELVFGESSFPQLQLLKFEGSNIVTWRLNKEAMPNLQHLIINNCPLLTTLPPELWNVKTLQKLDLSQASQVLARRVYHHLKENEGLAVQQEDDSSNICVSISEGGEFYRR